MSELKREPIKYIRDRIKRDYKERDFCYICGSTEKLELHHIYSVAELFSNWCNENNVNAKEISTVVEMEAIREQFYADKAELLDNTFLYCLCEVHHELLHNIYGLTYNNNVGPKIIRWIDRKKEQYDKRIS